MNLWKRGMRRWTTRWTRRVVGSGRRVLVWGDGLAWTPSPSRRRASM